MAAYTVAHDYRAVYRYQAVGFTSGATVEVDDDLAAWVNTDSPGCLVLKDEPKPPVGDEQADAKPKRGSRGGA